MSFRFCPQCGDRFRARRAKQRYCLTTCQRAAHGNNGKGKRRQPAPDKNRGRCVVCGESFRRYHNRLKKCPAHRHGVA